MRTGLGVLQGTLTEAAHFIRQIALSISGKPAHRIAVTGRPGIGKTYAIRPSIPLLEEHGFAVESSDELVLGHAWDDQVKRLLAWADPKERWLLEGVTVARALRHGLTAQAVVTFHGTPLRPKLTPAALRLGDQVYKWVDEAKKLLPNVKFYEWHVVERKFG